MESPNSLNGTYDDLSSYSVGRLKLRASDYEEIFADSSTSSFPEIELLDLGEWVGSNGADDVEYESIFGGFDDDAADVAPPYEVLFGGTAEDEPAKETAESPISVGIKSPFLESSPQYVSKGERSFNKASSDRISVLLNQISTRDCEQSNGNSHIEQLAHVVPVLACLVDGNNQPQIVQGDNRTTYLQREVSRTLSFSEEIESVKADVKSSPSRPMDRSYVMDKAHLRLPNFHSKDASERNTGDQSFSFFESDENSSAAESASALKKAIEQAQKSISVAKISMERKTEGLQDGLEPKTDLPITDWNAKASDELCYHNRKENNACTDCEFRTFTKVDCKLAQVVSTSEELFHAKDVEVRNGKFATLSHQDENFYSAETVKSGNAGVFIDLSAEGAQEAPDVVVSENVKTANSGSSKVRTDSLMCFIRKNVTRLKDMATGIPFPHKVATNSESKLKFSSGPTMPNELGISAEKDTLELERMKKMSEDITGLRHNCNLYMTSCDDDEDIHFFDEEDQQWFETEEQLMEEEEDPEVYQEVDVLRPNLIYNGDGQNSPEHNESAERLMGEGEATYVIQEVGYGHNKVKENADIQKVDGTDDRFGLSRDSFTFQFHRYSCETANKKATDNAVFEDLNDGSNVFSCDTESGSFPEYATDERLNGNSMHSSSEGLYSDSDNGNVGCDDEKPQGMFKSVKEVTSKDEGSSDDLPCKNEAAKFDLTYKRNDLEQTSGSEEGSEPKSNLESIVGFSAHEPREHSENEMDNFSTKDEVNGDLNANARDDHRVEEKSKRLSSEDACEGTSDKDPEENKKSAESISEQETCQNTEINNDKPITEENSVRGGHEHQYDQEELRQRIEAIKRGRERQKNKIAAERAMREARERAFANAQQRAMANAQQKLERGTKAKLKEERAAVERATAEARERALQKAMSLNDARTKDDKHPMERPSTSSWNRELKHSFSSSDLDRFDRTGTESAERRKAILERQQRIRERVERARDEKNMRDLLVQKEQAERNRLAQRLDVEIKRWSSGKEGDLRALLSTLQYILGPTSAWQPITLTEIITSAAVKKAYKKATLYLHPDKLQQRGASVRQKYICEKVFDLLQSARNRFNSD